MLGIGAVIGTGIFVIIGEAITESGAAIVISFVLAGVTCIFSALAYAELASTLPVSGSAYTYAYATMGEVFAWIIGWDVILEYGVSVAAVAVGWGAYFVELLDSLFGVTLSDSITLPPGEGGDVNVPAFVLVLAVASVLIAGIRQSARWRRARLSTPPSATGTRACAATRPELFVPRSPPAAGRLRRSPRLAMAGLRRPRRAVDAWRRRPRPFRRSARPPGPP